MFSSLWASWRTEAHVSFCFLSFSNWALSAASSSASALAARAFSAALRFSWRILLASAAALVIASFSNFSRSAYLISSSYFSYSSYILSASAASASNFSFSAFILAA